MTTKATKLSEQSASKTATPSRTTGKKAIAKKATAKKAAGTKSGKKRSSPGMFRRAAHAVGEVLLGAATGAAVGAVTGAVEAGGKEMGIPKATENKDSSQNPTTEEPSGKKPKKRR